MMTRVATVADCTRLLAQVAPERRHCLAAVDFAAMLEPCPMTWAGVEPAGAVVCVGGIMDTEAPSIGYVWQVIDPAAVARNKRAYLRQSRVLLALAHRRWPHLSVCIEPDNAPAQRHVMRLGGRLAGAATLPDSQDVVVFSRSRS